MRDVKDKYTPPVCTFFRPSCVQKTRLTNDSEVSSPSNRHISAYVRVVVLGVLGVLSFGPKNTAACVCIAVDHVPGVSQPKDGDGGDGRGGRGGRGWFRRVDDGSRRAMVLVAGRRCDGHVGGAQRASQVGRCSPTRVEYAACRVQAEAAA